MNRLFPPALVVLVAAALTACATPQVSGQSGDVSEESLPQTTSHASEQERTATPESSPSATEGVECVATVTYELAPEAGRPSIESALERYVDAQAFAVRAQATRAPDDPLPSAIPALQTAESALTAFRRDDRAIEQPNPDLELFVVEAIADNGADHGWVQVERQSIGYVVTVVEIHDGMAPTVDECR
jgi:hypothetical protein